MLTKKITSNIVELKDRAEYVSKILADEAERRDMPKHVQAKIRRMTKNDLQLLTLKIQYLTGRS